MRGRYACDDPSVRILLAVGLLLLTGCSAEKPASSSDSTTPSETPAPTAASTAPSNGVSGPCALLTTSEVEGIMGESVGESKPGLAGGLPNCQWAASDGRYVQTAGVGASDWAQVLPALIQALEASGQFDDTANLRKLREGSKLVEAGQDLEADQACSLFSQMVELQGRPPGTKWIVTVAPTHADPKAVSGQMCAGGRFTSVMVADVAGLDAPLPVNEVRQAIKIAHRRNTD